MNREETDIAKEIKYILDSDSKFFYKLLSFDSIDVEKAIIKSMSEKVKKQIDDEYERMLSGSGEQNQNYLTGLINNQ